MNEVAVIVATYGNDEKWTELAERAMESVSKQTVEVDLLRSHHPDSLAIARNKAAEMAGTPWTIFLDADDELDPLYVEKMLAGPRTDLTQPSTLGIVNGVEDDEPVLIPKTNLLFSNYLVIGTMVRTDLFLKVGGFNDLKALEDWECWIRCYLAGATFGEQPEAIYRVHVSPASRNQNRVLHNQVYAQIRQKYASY